MVSNCGYSVYLRPSMTVNILGCGWYGLALAKFFVEKGIIVKGSTTSTEKLSTLAQAGMLTGVTTPPIGRLG